MLKIAFVIYREWGYKIFKQIYQYQKINQSFTLDLLIVANNIDFKIENKFKKNIKVIEVDPKNNKQIYQILSDNKIKIACFYSWSFIISQTILDNFICLCLHPSKLPKYRGGTPIQNQLINGETTSAITIFKMSNEIDAGDIYGQKSMSLSGTVLNIFNRMTKLGVDLTKNLISDSLENKLLFLPQKNPNSYQVYKRRKPEQSEVKLKDLKNINYQELYNLVRGLLGPYPRAFIKLVDCKILIEKIKKTTIINKNYILNLKTDYKTIKKNKNIFLNLKDGFVEIVNYSIEKL